MGTYLLAWNPTRWLWDNLQDESTKVKNGDEVTRLWSCRNKKIEVGDRVFIIRLGKEPKGIFASGKVLEITESQHWDTARSELIPYTRIRFDKLLNPDKGDKIVSITELSSTDFQPMYWSTQKSGVHIPESVVDHLETVWKKY